MLIDGKLISEQIKTDFKDIFLNMGVKMRVVIIVIGTHFNTQKRAVFKQKILKEAGIHCSIIGLREDMEADEILETIQGYDENDLIDGIIVEKPFPKDIEEDVIYEMISPMKDLEGVSPFNLGRLKYGALSLVRLEYNAVDFLLMFYLKIKRKNNLKVLVDDDFFLSQFLSLKGYDVVCANSKHSQFESLLETVDAVVLKNKFDLYKMKKGTFLIPLNNNIKLNNEEINVATNIDELIATCILINMHISIATKIHQSN